MIELLRLPALTGAPLRLSFTSSDPALAARHGADFSIHLGDRDLDHLSRLLRAPCSNWVAWASTWVGGLRIDMELLLTWEPTHVRLELSSRGRQGSVRLTPEQAQVLARSIENRQELEVDLAALAACGALPASELATPQRMASVLDVTGADAHLGLLCAVPCDVGTVVVETELLDALIVPVASGQSTQLKIGVSQAHWNARTGLLTLMTDRQPLAEYEKYYDQLPRGEVRAPAGQRAWLLETLWHAAHSRAVFGVASGAPVQASQA